MRTGIRIVIGLLVILLGAAFVAYPYISDYVHRLRQHEVISVQDDVVDDSEEEVLAQELGRAADYNDRLASGQVDVADNPGSDANPGARADENDEYEELLNLEGDGVMGTLVIPKIDVRMPIYHYADDEELQRGVGHVASTSLPVGGSSTHCVLTGHNGLPSVKIFDRLDELEVGDYFVVEVLGEELAYRVTGKQTVLPEETESLAVQEGRDLMTLVTCTPYGVNTHRLLVHAERCDLPAEWTEGDRDQMQEASVEPSVPLVEYTIAGVVIAAALAISGSLVSRGVRLRSAARGGKHLKRDGLSEPHDDRTRTD